MKVITLQNEKGGVGKTTLTQNIASALAILGKRVVVVDGDGQGTLTRSFGLANAPAFYDLMVRGASWRDTLQLVDPARITVPDDANQLVGNIFILAGNPETRGITDHVKDASRLLKRIQELKNSVDFVLFDTSPSPSMLNVLILMASDGILYPTQLETFSIDGLMNSLTVKDEIGGYRQSLGYAPIEIYGVVPTMANMNTIEHSENFKTLQNHFGSLLYPAIQRRIIWAETGTVQRSIFAYAPESECAKDIWRLVKKLDKIVGLEIAL